MSPTEKEVTLVAIRRSRSRLIMTTTKGPGPRGVSRVMCVYLYVCILYMYIYTYIHHHTRFYRSSPPYSNGESIISLKQSISLSLAGCRAK